MSARGIIRDERTVWIMIGIMLCLLFVLLWQFSGYLPKRFEEFPGEAEVHRRISQWEQHLDRSKPAILTIPYGKRYVTISTAELEAGLDGEVFYDDGEVRDSEYFVVPPGKWVHSSDEAMKAWRATGK